MVPEPTCVGKNWIFYKSVIIAIVGGAVIAVIIVDEATQISHL